MSNRLVISLLVGLMLTGCTQGTDDAHRHGDGHAHSDDGSHGDHGHHDDHDERDDHGEGAPPHAHADQSAPAKEEAHGHGHGGGISVTHFSDATELFVEYPPLVSGEEAAFAAHLTWLRDSFVAVNEGTLVVALMSDQGEVQRAEASVSATPGIFRPVLVPGAAGKYRLNLTLQRAEDRHVHDLGEVEVHADPRAAAAAQPVEAEDDTAIPFTKEQQWKLDFAHAPVKARELRVSVAANAEIRPAANREALIVSPAAGTLDAGDAALPRLGAPVTAGQRLVNIVPRLATGVDLATLEADLQRARIRVEHTVETVQRLRKLAEAEAIAASRVVHAEHRAALARADLRAAERRFGMARDQHGGIPLRAPLEGTVIDVHSVRGAAVNEGDPLLRIANLDRVWLVVQVPEADLGRIQSPSGVFFQLDPDGPAQILEVGGGTQLVAFGGVVDRDTRTVPAIFEIENAGQRLRIGMRLGVRIYTGVARRELTVPAAAVLDDNGQSVVFVMRDGESFARRIVRTGLRDGDHIAIESGLAEGERVVTRGAYPVRLAASAPAEMGHGHAH